MVDAAEEFSGKIAIVTGATRGMGYAVAIFYGAIRQRHYTCYLKPDTFMPSWPSCRLRKRMGSDCIITPISTSMQ